MRAAFVLGLVSASSVLFVALLASATPPVSRSSGAPSGPNAHTSSSAGPAPTAAPKGSAEPHPPRVPLWARAPREIETPERNDAHRVVVDRIVAVVGRSVITLSELRRRAATAERTLGSTSLHRPSKTQIEQQTLDQLIEEVLVGDVATRKSLVVTEGDVDSALEEVLRSNHLTREALLKAVADALMTEESYRQDLRRQMLRYKVMQAVIVPRAKSSPGISSDEWLRRLEAEFKVWSAEQRRETFVEVRL